MTGKDRILTALSVKEPDRVPLYIHGINEAPIIGIGRHITEGLPEPKPFQEMNDLEKGKLVDALFLVHEEFEIDGFTAFDIGLESVVDKEHVKNDWGVVYELSPYGIPIAKGHPIKGPMDLRHYTPPKPKKAYLLLLDLARERFKGDKALFWLMRSTFVRSWHLTGMENLMLQMFDNPGFVHQIAQMVLDYNLQMLEMLFEAGMDVLIVEDDIADKTSTLISPDQFREFINPYNKQLVDKAHKKGLKVVRHSDGNLWPIMDILLKTDYDGLNPLEPQADMGLKKVKDYCGDRLCLIGNIDCIDLLPNGTPEQVRDAVQQAIRDAAKGGGLIISSSNSLHPGVNPENCIAMFEATKKYGVYEKKDAC